MGLLSKLFGKDGEAAAGDRDSSQFHESEASTDQQAASRNTPRRELVQVVLRDTMRQHGIPSDWMDCRILSVVTRSKVSGIHVQLLVHQGHDQLLAYVFAFQESFLRELQKFEPRYGDWLLSVAWQFEGRSGAVRPMPDPASWAQRPGLGTAAAGATAGFEATEAGAEDGDDVEADLRALFAIRDAAIAQPVPTLAPAAAGDAAAGTAGAATGDDSQDEDAGDFQATRPGFIDSSDDRR